MDLSELMRNYRRDNIISQEELGKQLGITRVMVSNVEKYHRTGGNKVMRGLVRILNLSTLEIVSANLEQSIKIEKLKGEIK